MPFDKSFYDMVLGRSGSVLGDWLGSTPGGSGFDPTQMGINFGNLTARLPFLQAEGAAARQRQQAQAAGQTPGANQKPPAAQPGQTANSITGQPQPGDQFFPSVLSMAQDAEKATGVPATLNMAVAANETGHGTQGGAPWNSYHGIRGNGSAGMTPGGFRANNTPQESFMDFGNLLTNPSSVYAPAWQQYQQDKDVKRLMAGIAAAGYASKDIIMDDGRTEAQHWIDQIGPLIDQAEHAQTQDAIYKAAGRTPGNIVTTGTSQYDLGLPENVADVFCGPAAAMEFATKIGRTPTAMEAMNLAKEVGWNARDGMAGPDSEVQLLRSLGVPAYAEAPNPSKIVAEVRAGRPVIIDTPGHYYQIIGYNEGTGGFVMGDAVGKRFGPGGISLDDLGSLKFGPARTAIYMQPSQAG